MPFARAQASAARLKSIAGVNMALTSTASMSDASAIQLTAKRAGDRIERVRRHHEPVRPSLERSDVVEASHSGDVLWKVDQEDVLALDRALDSREEQDAAACGIGGVRGRIEVAIVKCDGKRVVAERRRVLEELPVVWVMRSAGSPSVCAWSSTFSTWRGPIPDLLRTDSVDQRNSAALSGRPSSTPEVDPPCRPLGQDLLKSP